MTLELILWPLAIIMLTVGIGALIGMRSKPQQRIKSLVTIIDRRENESFITDAKMAVAAHAIGATLIRVRPATERHDPEKP